MIRGLSKERSGINSQAPRKYQRCLSPALRSWRLCVLARTLGNRGVAKNRLEIGPAGLGYWLLKSSSIEFPEQDIEAFVCGGRCSQDAVREIGNPRSEHPVPR